MKNAIIIHGMPDKESYFDTNADCQSNSHWLPWLQQQLNTCGILSQTPEMPEPYNPNYESWKNIFEQFQIDEDTVLVGHSCGAGFIVKYLSENNIKVGKVVLVAPWINVKNEDNITMFNNMDIDKDLITRTSGVTMFSSSNDDESIKDSVEVLRRRISTLKVLEFENYGHFCLNDMKTKAFPELLREIIE